MEIRDDLRQWLKTIPTNQDETLLFLLAIRHDIKFNASESIYTFLSKEGIIKRDFIRNKIILTIPIYIDDLGEALKVDTSEIQEIENRVDEYRRLFRGLRSGSMGNKATVVEYLQRFCVENSKSFDEILNVTQKALEGSNRTYFPNADNFIYDMSSGKERSRLLISFEEYEESSSLFRNIDEVY